MLRKTSLLISLAALALTACAKSEQILPGERLNVRDVLTGGYDDGAAPASTGPQARAFSTPASVTNTDWAQSPVSPMVRVTNPALGQVLKPLFSVGIGAGDGRKTRLNADPIVAGGRIFTMAPTTRSWQPRPRVSNCGLRPLSRSATRRPKDRAAGWPTARASCSSRPVSAC